ncbi:unknown [Bacteroides sp. CAG:633]|nr:unknown [Bacteroides sp. CAG:633]
MIEYLSRVLLDRLTGWVANSVLFIQIYYTLVKIIHFYPQWKILRIVIIWGKIVKYCFYLVC